jgi:hypothetical protein
MMSAGLQVEAERDLPVALVAKHQELLSSRLLFGILLEARVGR